MTEEFFKQFIKENITPCLKQKQGKKNNNIKFIKFFLLCKKFGFLPGNTCLTFCLDRYSYKKLTEIGSPEFFKNLDFIVTNWMKFKVGFENKKYFLIQKNKLCPIS